MRTVPPLRDSVNFPRYFLGNAPPYATDTDAERRALMAERVESLVSQEHAKWASVQQQVTIKTGGDKNSSTT